MDRVVTRAGIWFAVMLVALFAAATAADDGFAIHMGIVMVAAAVVLWITAVWRQHPDRVILLCRAAHLPRATGFSRARPVRLLGLPALHRARCEWLRSGYHSEPRVRGA